MKYLKKYRLFENHEDIHDICKKYNISSYTINEDGSIDVNGDVGLYNKELTKLPLRFKNVSGGFNCNSNPVHNIWILFEDYSKIELFNDYDCLREIDGKPTVILDRLNDFLQEIGKRPVEKVKGWINI